MIPLTKLQIFEIASKENLKKLNNKLHILLDKMIFKRKKFFYVVEKPFISSQKQEFMLVQSICQS